METLQWGTRTWLYKVLVSWLSDMSSCFQLWKILTPPGQTIGCTFICISCLISQKQEYFLKIFDYFLTSFTGQCFYPTVFKMLRFQNVWFSPSILNRNTFLLTFNLSQLKYYPNTYEQSWNFVSISQDIITILFSDYSLWWTNTLILNKKIFH